VGKSKRLGMVRTSEKTSNYQYTGCSAQRGIPTASGEPASSGMWWNRVGIAEGSLIRCVGSTVSSQLNGSERHRCLYKVPREDRG